MITNLENQTMRTPALPPVARKAYSMREGCAMLGISVATGYRRAAEGKLKITKIGSRSVLSDEEITRIAREGA